MRTVAAIPAYALVAGAAYGVTFADLHRGAAAPSLVAACLIVLAGWRTRRSWIIAAGVATTFFVGGAALGARAWQHAWRPPLRALFDEVADHGEAFVTIDGTLRSDATRSASGVSIGVDVDAASPLGTPSASRSRDAAIADGGVLLSVLGSIAPARMDEWRAGRRVRLTATLRRPAVYLDPGVADNERALARRGTTLVGSVKSGALVEVVARAPWYDEALGAVRAFARRAIAEAVGRWDPQAGAIVAAIVIGDRAGLDGGVQRRLQDAGTYHVIAISGGNIAILAGLLLGAFRVAGWAGRTGLVAAVLLLVAYARLVGGGASVDRATLMAAVYLAARIVDQRTAPLNSLAVVAALIVLCDPLAVADPAFVLTFGATLAILLAPALSLAAKATPSSADAARRRRRPPAVRSLMRALASMLIASVAVEALLFPVGALVFSRVTFAGLALNFVAIPLMAIAQVAGMIVVPLALVARPLAGAAGAVAAAGAVGLVRSADLVRVAPAIAYRIAPPSAVAVAAYYGAVAITWVCCRWTAPRSVTGVAALAASVGALWMLIDPASLVARRGDGRLHVTFIDVGQSDAAFVRFPHGATMLVDAGGLSFGSTFDIGDRVVGPVLRAAGAYRLDVVALSHGDPDHIGGARAIVGEFRPREVWEGIPVPRSDALAVLRQLAQEAGARWANVYGGDRASFDGVEILARHPPPADWERQRVRNDDSLVLELRWREISVLFTGDVGERVEASLAASLPPAPLRLVKVAHHGSATSSSEAFVNAIRPAVAVVSVGRGNRFGHPAPDVIARYRATGAAIFRTDQDGAIAVDSDGASLRVRTFFGRELLVGGAKPVRAAGEPTGATAATCSSAGCWRASPG